MFSYSPYTISLIHWGRRMHNIKKFPVDGKKNPIDLVAGEWPQEEERRKSCQMCVFWLCSLWTKMGTGEGLPKSRPH